MQVLFPPQWLTIVLYIVVWPIIHIGFSLLGNRIPDSFFYPDSFLFRSRKWENDGHVYQKVLRIQSWKRLLPDGARFFKKGFEKAELKSKNTKYLSDFAVETCRAEFVHWLQMLSFWVFGLWTHTFIIWIMLGYALAVNLPCILAQRYNRPRLIRLLKHIELKSINGGLL